MGTVADRSSASPRVPQSRSPIFFFGETAGLPRHFDREPAKFAQKRGCKFYWRPAGSIAAGRFELIFKPSRPRFCLNFALEISAPVVVRLVTMTCQTIVLRSVRATAGRSVCLVPRLESDEWQNPHGNGWLTAHVGEGSRVSIRLLPTFSRGTTCHRSPTIQLLIRTGFAT